MSRCLVTAELLHEMVETTLRHSHSRFHWTEAQKERVHARAKILHKESQSVDQLINAVADMVGEEGGQPKYTWERIHA